MKEVLAYALFVAQCILALPAQQQEPECPPLFLGGGLQSIPPALIEIDCSVTPLDPHGGGTCPNSPCRFRFDLDVKVKSPNWPGQAFELTFQPPVPALIVPVNIPYLPNEPWYTQGLDQVFTIDLLCMKQQQVELRFPGPLGMVVVAWAWMTCGGECP